MEIESTVDGGKLLMKVSLTVSIDGTELVLTADTESETFAIRKKSSQINWAAAAASLSLANITRQIHRLILPQLRVGIADAVSAALPPVDDEGPRSASTGVPAMYIAPDADTPPEALPSSGGD